MAGRFQKSVPLAFLMGRLFVIYSLLFRVTKTTNNKQQTINPKLKTTKNDK
jgi:hypothetical protein